MTESNKTNKSGESVASKPKMTLRPFRQDELHYYVDWMRDPKVLGHYVEPEDWTLAKLQDDFAKDQWQSPRLRRWMIVDENSGQDSSQDSKILGFAHCWEFDPYEKHVEFGRILLPDYRGKGLGVPLLCTILDKICQETEAHRMQSMTACDNIAVVRNWKAIGLTLDARLKEYMTLHGQFTDCWLGSILRPEWLKRRESLKL